MYLHKHETLMCVHVVLGRKLMSVPHTLCLYCSYHIGLILFSIPYANTAYCIHDTQLRVLACKKCGLRTAGFVQSSGKALS